MNETVCFLLPWSLHDPGGVNQVVRDLDTHISDSDLAKTIIAVTNPDAKTPSGPDYNKQLYFPLPAPPASAVSIPKYLVKLGIFILRLSHSISTKRITVFNAHYPSEALYSLALGLSILRRKKVRLILSFHGSDVERLGFVSDFTRRLWRGLLNRSDALIFCSRSLQRQFLDIFPGLDDRAVVVHNGINLEDIRQCKESPNEIRLPPMPGDQYLLCVGNYHPWKGQDILLEAFEYLANDYPRVDVMFVGSEGSMGDQLRRFAENSPHSGRIHVVGPCCHAETLQLIRNAVGVVVPSRREAFSLVMLEAGALGIPVIASEVGGIPEVIKNLENGLLFRSEDAKLLEVQIRRTLDQPDSAKSMAACLQNHVLENHAWDNVVERYFAIMSGSHNPPK